MGKVRIYELARDLKMESRQIIEHARRMGVDVSVPSNSLDEPVAEKIREIYFPKKEPTVTHKARLVKHARPQTAPESPEVPTPLAPAEQAAAPVIAQQVEAAPPEAARPRLVRIVPPSPSAEPEAVAEPEPPAFEPVIETAAEVEEAIAPAPEPPLPEPMAAEPAPVAPEPQQVIREIVPPVAPAPPAPVAAPVVSAPPAAPVPPPAKAPVAPPQHRTAPPGRPASTTNVIRLATPTRPLPKPVQPQRPAPSAPPARPVPGRPGAPRPGAPGQAATKDKAEVHLLPSGAVQRTTYVPPRDNRHKGRHAKPRGGVADKQEGHQKPAPGRRPVVQVAQRAVPAELKLVRLVEGSTVREFAEKL